ncbi:MAG: hypothetical protein Ct9H300mP21_04470 [Pseudomonadota bacterium]|nr:MAG: hypothetical protein Ct9H300mP21_04470 [Pseudomonadota bacterium]
MMASADGSFGYEMEIIVPADSDIKSVADIKGRRWLLPLLLPIPDSRHLLPF